MAKVRIKDVIDMFNLELVSGEEGINRPILTSDVSRPGLEIAGFFDYYPAERLQLLGRTEVSFFTQLNEAERKHRMKELCRDSTPGIIITRGQIVPEELIEASERESVPVMLSNKKTTRLYSRLTNFLESRLAPTTAVHVC